MKDYSDKHILCQQSTHFKLINTVLSAHMRQSTKRPFGRMVLWGSKSTQINRLKQEQAILFSKMEPNSKDAFSVPRN